MSAEVEGLRTVNVKELSALTGIHVWRLRELVKTGDGPPSFRTGRMIRFPVESAKQWLKDQCAAEKG